MENLPMVQRRQGSRFINFIPRYKNIWKPTTQNYSFRVEILIRRATLVGAAHLQ